MKEDTVFHTGAAANDFLEGAEDANRGLRVQVRTRQPRGVAGPIDGNFVLVAAGDGPYRELLAPFQGVTTSAKQLIKAVREEPGGKRFTHILNGNMLRRSSS